MMQKRHTLIVVAAGAMSFMGPPLLSPTAHAQDTPLNDVFMYGVDADTNKLLRYQFSTDEFITVGQIRDQAGKLVVDIESMAYIPSGPDKGFYATTNFRDKNPTKLIKIDPFTADAWVYELEVGFWKVTGLVAKVDAMGNWTLIGATKNTAKADFQAKLIEINPTTGVGTEIMDLGIMMMAGLAIDGNGTLYGVDRGLNLAGEVPPGTESDLYIIDPWPAPGTLTHIGPLPWNKVEALEFGFGRFAPPIDCSTVPGVGPGWTDNGVLMGFSDAFNMLMIIDPATGNAVPYPGTFVTVDCEGLVFTTYENDPLYGVLRGFD